MGVCFLFRSYFWPLCVGVGVHSGTALRSPTIAPPLSHNTVDTTHATSCSDMKQAWLFIPEPSFPLIHTVLFFFFLFALLPPKCPASAASPPAVSPEMVDWLVRGFSLVAPGSRRLNNGPSLHPCLIITRDVPRSDSHLAVDLVILGGMMLFLPEVQGRSRIRSRVVYL